MGSVAAASVHALGFGPMPESTVFGQTLDLAIPLRAGAVGETPPGCLSAEVKLGDRAVPASALHLSIDGQGGNPGDRRLRLRSPVVVLEPLVEVRVSVGCEAPMTRQFVVFADPPALLAQAALASAEPPSAPTAVAALPHVREVAVVQAPRRTGSKSKRPIKPTKVTRKTETVSRKLAAAKPVPVATGRAEAATSRLKLEEPDELLRVATHAVAMQDVAVASAEQAAKAAEVAASAAEARVAALERELLAMRADAEANRAAMAQMRSRMAQAEDQHWLTWPLALLAAVFAGLTIWLAWRLRALQRERHEGWWQVAQAAIAEPAHDGPDAAAPAPEIEAPASVPVEVAASPAAPDTSLPLVASEATTDGELGPSALTRAVSVDELIDLEQQAEFFVVLGEADSAVDLLMAHLRGSGGVSPLPYLKLLEIYRRGDDRDAYERIRKRFNHRFNALAPDWDDDLERGRDLQDYPAVLSSLQAAWHSPLDAMAELESLLFRKRGGEMFDLPAYRDVLSLYAVARDLHRRADQEADDVDVLLPLGHDYHAEVTARQSVFDPLASARGDGALRIEDLPTAPVDLDLSAPEGFTDNAPARR